MSNISFQITIDGTDYTSHVPFPIKWEDLLDERLDEARITLKAVSENVFSPLTPVVLTVSDSFNNQITKDYVVATSYANESPAGSGLYNVELSIIEPTKVLERFLIDTVTFTNDLGRIYTNNPYPVTPILASSAVVPRQPDDISTYVTPLQKGETFVFVSASEVFYTETHTGVYSPTISGTVTLSLNGSQIDSTTDMNQSFTVVLETGTYQILYNLGFDYSTAETTIQSSAQYTFASVSNTEPLPLWNIATVIDRLLTIAEPLRLGDTPRFVLDSTQRAQLEAIQAPEFAFTSNTLKEALDQIGGFIHAIPRLINGNVIHFDFLGGIEVAQGVKDYPYCTETFSLNVENYCTKIDSRVDNLVNVLNPEQGVITDPLASANGIYVGRSVRTETVYARISETEMVIPTFFPIQEIKSVVAGYLPGVDYTGGDLTPYVFEEADYIRLSTTSNNYPDSRAYAIYYTQGEKNIKGLGFKIENPISSIFENYSIVNILQNTSGNSGYTVPATEYPLLYFIVSYIPIYSARVEQTKSDISPYSYPSALAYNQSANLIETRYYGENMKGVIARMGNVERMRTFVGQRLSSIPKVGQLFDDDYYISSVAVEVDPFDYKCTLGLSKDFNRLSQYIGINSMKRFYEVSEKQAYRRDFHYTDYMVISDEEQTPDNTLISTNALWRFSDEFVRTSSTDNTVTFAQATGSDSLPAVTLPVIRSAFGNAMVFTFQYEDNYGAGTKSVLSTSSSASVSGYYMENVSYSDVYGRLENLYVEFGTQDSIVRLPSQYQDIALNFPQYEPITTTGAGILTTGQNPFVILKDSKEALAINYQIEFVSTSSKYVIGSAIARNHPLISGPQTSRYAALYILQTWIPKFADVLDLTGATLVKSYAGSGDVYQSAGQIKFNPVTASASGQAWAFVDNTTGELLFGKNEAVQQGQTITLPTMTPKHKIFD